MEDFEARLGEVSAVIQRYVRFRLDIDADAEDVFQEVCLTAYQKYEQLSDKTAFKSWLLAIARNKCSDYFRRRGKLREVPLEEASLIYGRQGLTVQTAVGETMDVLSPQDRELLRLSYWEELPQNEIAKRLGIPVGTVKSRLHYAKNRFKAHYPYPPGTLKGANMKTKLPEFIPEYTITPQNREPFPVRWEELQGWLIVPRVGEKLTWGMYDFPERRRTEYTEMEVVGKAEVHGIEGVEVVAMQYDADNRYATGSQQESQWRFIAQLTPTHSRFLAETHVENGVRQCHTFLDGDVFLENWGYGEDNCGHEIDLAPKGILRRDGSYVTANVEREAVDVVGRYTVTINGKSYDTVCVMDVEYFDEAVASEQYIDRNGRTVLWRRFNRDDWAIDRFGGKPWSEKLPDNERITVNGETFVHWYDCITDYIL